MTEYTDIQIGNAEIDSVGGWFVGSILNESLGLRHTDDVEIKWSKLNKGEEHSDWVIENARTTVAILISGKYEVIFRDQTKILSSEGDFVMWGKDRDHKGCAIEDSTILTVRWPSIPRRS